MTRGNAEQGHPGREPRDLHASRRVQEEDRPGGPEGDDPLDGLSDRRPAPGRVVPRSDRDPPGRMRRLGQGLGPEDATRPAVEAAHGAVGCRPSREDQDIVTEPDGEVVAVPAAVERPRRRAGPSCPRRPARP